jgi:hypothetical protein
MSNQTFDLHSQTKAVPVLARRDPEGSRSLGLPGFKKVVRLSALRTGLLYPQEIFLPEGLCHCKFPMT